MTQSSISAVWRSSRRRDWQPAEIVSNHPSSGQLVLREVDRFWPGVWLAPRDQVRVAGPEFDPAPPDRGISTGCSTGSPRRSRAGMPVEYRSIGPK